MKVVEHQGLTEIKNKNRVIFCHWHGDELVVIRLGPPYHCAAMTSTSKDGELMDKVLNFLGFGTSRGSSTRGGARALIGMIKLMEQGYHATIAVDGPKGPRHKVKPGAWALAKHTGAPIIPMGVARKAAFVFNRSWNKTYLPWPLTKVVVTFGAPMYVNNSEEKSFCEELEKQIFIERGRAQKLLFSSLVAFLVLGCASSSELPTTTYSSGAESLLQRSVHTPLTPRGQKLTGLEPAVIRYLKPGGLAAKLGFKLGDVILKINGKPVNGFVELEKRIKNAVSPVEVTYKSKNQILTKLVHLHNGPNRWDASTEKQGVALIKTTSPGIVFMTKPPYTVFCTASISQEKNALFVNIIIDSDDIKPSSSAVLNVKSKNGSISSKSVERVDALSGNSVLVSKKIPLSGAKLTDLNVLFSLEKQQFTFEFQE